MIKAARTYIKEGISVFGCTNKKPNLGTIGTWIPFRTKLASEEELDIMFEQRKAEQIAIVCGYGDLEVIDIDTKYDLSGTIFDRLWTDIVDLFDGNPPFTPIRTQSGGYHIYLRADNIEGNQALAKVKQPDGSTRSVIETRGIGGYVIAPPSSGYKCLDGSDMIRNIPTLQEWERDALIDICRSYNEIYKIQKPKGETNETKSYNYKTTPWDAYNNDESEPWRDLLISEGWEVIKETDEREYWKRPGSENYQSANWHYDKRLFYVFSSSTRFEAGKAYTPASIHAVLKYDGDFSKSASDLLKEGYGRSLSIWEQKLVERGKDEMIKGRTQAYVAEMLSKDTDSPEIDIDLRSLRSAMGLSQSQLGEYLEVSKQMISKVERGERSTPSDWLNAIRMHPDFDIKKNEIREIIEAADEVVKEFFSGELHEKIMESVLARYDATAGPFWYVNSSDQVKIDTYRFMQFITDNGFRLLKEKTYHLKGERVHMDMQKKHIHNFDRVYLKKFVEHWIKEADLSDVDVTQSQLMNAILNLTNSKWDTFTDHLEQISMDEVKILRDNPEKAYLPFANGVVEVSSSGYRLLKYEDLPQDVLIWKENINPHKIELLHLETEADRNKLSFYKWLKRLSGLKPETDALSIEQIKEQFPMAYERFQALTSHIGYLLHTYRDPSRPWLVFVGEDTIDHGRGGGTGKSLLGQAIGSLRKEDKINGKDFDTKDKFKWQSMTLGTEVLRIEDVPPWFKVENIYNEITEQMSMERKFMDPVKIPYERLPKLMITSNYDIEGNGAEHFKRRVKKVLIEKRYSSSFRPVDEFGEQFFGHEWNENPSTWDSFYNVMFCFLRDYLKDGIHESTNMHNLNAKSFIQRFKDKDMGRDVLDWFDNYFNSYFNDQGSNWTSHKEAYEELLTALDLEKSELSISLFKSKVKQYCQKFDIDVEKKSDDEGNYGRKGGTIYRYHKEGVEVKKTVEIDDDLPF